MPIPPTDLTPQIAESAAGPASVTGDSGSVHQHPLGDAIKADQYLKSGQALKRRRLGLRYVTLRPPGAHDVDICR